MTAADPQWLDRMYNNRALVPDHALYFSRWADTSAAARRDQPCTVDVLYGTGPNETLDIFPAPQAGAPVLVFIHGGYWRSLDKSDHSFVAPPLVAQGACVVVPNYALCPAVTIPQIAMQMVQALVWVHAHIGRFGGDARRITVAGHSAGGHLAAMLLVCDWSALGGGLPAGLVRNALSISGLYDLQPLVDTPFLKDSLRLTPADALRASPACMAAPAGTLYTVAGGDESAEFLRHNRLIRDAWGDKTVPVCEELPGRNHFSAVDALAEPGHRLNTLARQLLA